MRYATIKSSTEGKGESDPKIVEGGVSERCILFPNEEMALQGCGIIRECGARQGGTHL